MFGMETRKHKGMRLMREWWFQSRFLAQNLLAQQIDATV
jgi:hypothetical protein